MRLLGRDLTMRLLGRVLALSAAAPQWLRIAGDPLPRALGPEPIRPVLDIMTVPSAAST
jgi:hypothetical protein